MNDKKIQKQSICLLLLINQLTLNTLFGWYCQIINITIYNLIYVALVLVIYNVIYNIFPNIQEPPKPTKFNVFVIYTYAIYTIYTHKKHMNKNKILNINLYEYSTWKTFAVQGPSTAHGLSFLIVSTFCIFYLFKKFIKKNAGHVYKSNSYIVNNTTLIHILYGSIYILLTGAYWAFYQDVWGNWFNNDPVEIIFLLFFIYLLCLIHYNKYAPSNKNTYLYYILITFFFLWMLRLGLLNSRHTNVSFNVKNKKNSKIILILLILIITTIFLSLKKIKIKKIKKNAVYIKNFNIYVAGTILYLVLENIKTYIILKQFFRTGYIVTVITTLVLLLTVPKYKNSSSSFEYTKLVHVCVCICLLYLTLNNTVCYILFTNQNNIKFYKTNKITEVQLSLKHVFEIKNDNNTTQYQQKTIKTTHTNAQHKKIFIEWQENVENFKKRFYKKLVLKKYNIKIQELNNNIKKNQITTLIRELKNKIYNKQVNHEGDFLFKLIIACLLILSLKKIS